MSVITRKRAYRIARFLCIIPGVIVGILFYGWANSPSSQPIKVDNPFQSSAAQVNTQPHTITTDYFTVQFPGSFKTQTNRQVSSSPLIQLLSYEPNSGGVQIGIVSNVLSAGGLSSVADYNLRATKPAEYQLISLPQGNRSVQAIFKNSDRSEFSAYLVNGSRYASITVSGPIDQPEMLQRRLQETLRDWEWR